MKWQDLRWSLYAPVYDRLTQPLLEPRRAAIDALDLRPKDRVLVVGAGTGVDLPMLPPVGFLAAVDLSTAMIRRLERRADRFGIRVSAKVADATALPFPDGQFDAVLLHLILGVVEDPEAVAREAARVLRPGGRVSVFDKFLPDGAEPSAARRAASAVARVIATDLNRQAGPILESAGLLVMRDEPAALGGLFRAILALKPSRPGLFAS